MLRLIALFLLIPTVAFAYFPVTGGESRQSEEWVLKPNTRYAVRFIPDSNNTRVVFTFHWYEQMEND